MEFGRALSAAGFVVPLGPHKRNPRPREDPAVQVDSDSVGVCLGRGSLDTGGADGWDEIQYGDVGNAAVSVVEVDLEAFGGLVDGEEEHVAVGGHGGAVGVADGDRLVTCLAEVEGVGLRVLALVAADWAGVAIDVEANQLEGGLVGGIQGG